MDELINLMKLNKKELIRMIGYNHGVIGRLSNRLMNSNLIILNQKKRISKIINQLQFIIDFKYSMKTSKDNRSKKKKEVI